MKRVLHNFILEGVPQKTVQQYDDNLRWLREAEKHKMVVGSQARILYSDQEGRVKIALAFNQAVKDGQIKEPVKRMLDPREVDCERYAPHHPGWPMPICRVQPP